MRECEGGSECECVYVEREFLLASSSSLSSSSSSSRKMKI